MASQSPLTMKFEVPTPPAEVVSKISEKEITEKYIYSSGTKQENSSLPYMDPALVDFQLLLHSDEEHQKFGSLINSWGCFQLVNHGITSSKLDQVIQVCKDFFALPVEEKQKYIQVPGQLEGWGGDTMSKDQNLNWNNRFLLFIYPVEQRNPKFWPDESLSKFREIVEDYAADLRKIFEVVCKAISKLLNLEEDNLLNEYAKDGIMGFRVNHYPSCPFPDKVVGLKAHSDVHILTFLLQDKEVEGLHVEKDGQWYKVPIVPGALVINTADMLEILTNGKVKSVYHRAVVDGTRERISLACGFGPPQNTEIGPLNELITEETPKLYKTDSNYVMTAVSNYALGNRTIDTMKIHRSSNI
ncbi:codeine O-demethylase-like [Silene latifolia]|uniref:codeine O-demethylase-like n=1 Tax=Silene latifolia TaxID=37657 RepID=UPI003D77BA2C